MKKSTSIIFIFSFAFSLISCKKDYVCKCTKTYTSSTAALNKADGTYNYTDSKPRAMERCNKNEGVDKDLQGEYSRNCEIQ